jgi:hypothetical protein
MAHSFPKKLYKYQPYSVQTLDNLKNRVLWFSRPAQFNDPFDSKIVPSEIEPLGEKDWQVLFKQVQQTALQAKKTLPYHGPEDSFKERVKEGIEKSFENNVSDFQQRGVACFSAKMDDILMWSHYADGHRGFCLEFDTTYEPFSKARPVIYAKTFPTLDAEEVAEVFIRRNPEPQMKFLFTKSGCWEYEQEWRVLHREGGTAYTFAAEALTGIYLGCEMTDVHEEIVVRLLAGSPTHLYEMKPAGTKFEVEWVQIK